MVGKSKVISGLNDWQAHRRRKDTSLASKVGPDAYQRMRDPKGTIGELFQPTFHAGLTNNDSGRTPGGNFLEATVVRGTSATYVDRNGILQLAGPNESRQEYANGQPLGTLMEPASTNTTNQLNATQLDPSEWILNGGPATIEVVYDLPAIRAAGLEKVCPNGEMLQITATGNCRYLCLESSPGSTDDVALSVYADGDFYLHSGYDSSTKFNHASIQKAAWVSPSPGNIARTFNISVDAGESCRFVLWQVENQPVATSTIITSGAATSRDVDQLSWPLDSILNQSQGMAAILWRPGFSDSDLSIGTAQVGRLLNTQGPRFLFHEKTATDVNNFVLDDGAAPIKVTITGGFVAGRDYLVTARWSGTTKYIRFKAAGVWATEVSSVYAGSFPENGLLRLYDLADAPQMQRPAHCRDVYLWSENRGAAWLESFFSGIAN